MTVKTVAEYKFTWSGEVDLYTSSQWLGVRITGSAVPNGSRVSRAYYRMKIRVHVNGETNSQCALWFENSSSDMMASDVVSPITTEVDPSWSEFRRILTFEIGFDSQNSGFQDFFVEQSTFKIANPLTSQISGGIAELLSIELVVITGTGNAVKYYDGTTWLPCVIRYYDGSKWISSAAKYIDSV